jgi:hypothetical protein
MLHREILLPPQHQALRLLSAPSRARRLHLGGGTAIALHLGHRRSVDLDWFATEPIGDPARLAASLRRDGVPLVTTAMAEGTLHGEVAGVETSFLDYPYPRPRCPGLLRRRGGDADAAHGVGREVGGDPRDHRDRGPGGEPMTARTPGARVV